MRLSSRLSAQTTFGAVRANLPMLGALDDHDYGRNDGGADNPYQIDAHAFLQYRWEAGEHADVERRRLSS